MVRIRKLVRRKIQGPVLDLESCVDYEWLDRSHLKPKEDTRTEVSQKINFILNIIKPQLEDKILELCCSLGDHSVEIAKRGFYIEGIDKSKYLLDKARRRARESEVNIKFKLGDARKLPYEEDTFNEVLILGNNFGYFPGIQDDFNVVKEALRVLKPSGRIVIEINDGEKLRAEYQKRSWNWISEREFKTIERQLSKDGTRVITRELVNHGEHGTISDIFYAERLYSKEKIKNLLEATGFSNCTVIDYQSEQSKGDERQMPKLLIIATAAKEWSRKDKNVEDQKKKITVILGDQNKKDIVKPDNVFDDDDIETLDKLKNELKKLEDTGRFAFTYLSNHDTLSQDLYEQKKKREVDFVLNLCDEGFNNDPSKEAIIPSLLEVYGIPYSGAGPNCLSQCFDKSLIRGICKELEIPVPEGEIVEPDLTDIENPSTFPVIVKPNFGDGSYGITVKSVAKSREEVVDAIEELKSRFGYDKQIIIEEFLPGQELSIGVIGNPEHGLTILPIIEEDYSRLPASLPRIVGYEAKWDENSEYRVLGSKVADIPKETEKRIIDYSVELFTRLSCRDYARFDWRLDKNGNPKLLEVNPNAGWCWDGHLAKMVELAGGTYCDFLQKVISVAEERIKKTKQ